MSSPREREIIGELIDLYRDLPCLWDITSESYRDGRQKKTAWEILLKKYKEFDQNANEARVKKKMNILKFGYQREAKKVKKSKISRWGDLHIPSLWYFKYFTFLDEKKDQEKVASDSDPLATEEGTFITNDLEESHSFQLGQGIDKEDLLTFNITKPAYRNISSDDDDMQEQQTDTIKLKRKRKHKEIQFKDEILLDNEEPNKTDELLKLLKPPEDKTPKTNSFRLYVGEKLDQLRPGQRQIAEKLISEVLFLAGIGKLQYDTRIETSQAKSGCTSLNQTTPPSVYFIAQNPATPQDPSISQNLIASQDPVILQYPVIPQNCIAPQNPVVPQNSVVSQGPVTTQNLVIPQNSVISQSSVIPQNPIAPQNPVAQQSPITPQKTVPLQNSDTTQNSDISQNTDSAQNSSSYQKISSHSFLKEFLISGNKPDIEQKEG